MKDKFLNFVGDLLVRYYMEIIAGIWAVMIMMPIDAALYKKVTGDETYLIDGNFAVMFVIYTIAFIALGQLLPVLRKKKLVYKMKHFVRQGLVTAAQSKQILETVNYSLSRQGLTSKYGLSQWIMKNLFSIGVTFSYFAAEGFIVNIMFGRPLTVPIVFTILFISLLVIEHIMDDRMARKMAIQRKKATSKVNVDNEYGQKKVFMIYLFDSIRGSNLSEKVSDVVYEDIISDILRIMKMSDDKDEAKMKRETPKIKPIKGKKFSKDSIKKAIVKSKKIKKVKKVERKKKGRKKEKKSVSNI